ncbi:hypothetical protein, partial [Yersinia sp. 2542 StPb PI]
VVDKVTGMHPKKEKPDITLCHSLPEIENAIQTIDQPIIFFDTDNVSRFDQFRLLKLIKQTTKSERIFIFTKESEESKYVVAVRYIASLVFSKTATQAQLESVFYPLLNSCNVIFKKKESALMPDKMQQPVLTQRESQVC